MATPVGPDTGPLRAPLPEHESLVVELDDPDADDAALRGQTRGVGAGVHGRAVGDGVGVVGSSTLGRGAVLSGGKAQLRLVPGALASHPPTGAAGDLYLDREHRLWFCTGGAGWTRLA